MKKLKINDKNNSFWSLHFGLPLAIISVKVYEVRGIDVEKRKIDDLNKGNIISRTNLKKWA
jgi:UDP-N-acetyl-D-mannosaminuronate dehydrogenase